MPSNITLKKLRYLPICVAAACAFSAQASQQNFDSRSFAMGNIGVSTADYLTAPFHNPALVARFNEDDAVALLFPSFGVDANDPTDIIDNVEDFSDIYDEFKNISNPTEDDAQKVINQLLLVQGNYAQVQAGTQLAVAIPSNTIAVNIFAQAYADALVFADIDENDLDPLKIINLDLDSKALTMGVVVTEFGVSLAKSYKTPTGQFYYGVSPKYQKVNTINYIADIDNYEFDDWDDDRYQSDESNFNIDIGFAYQHNAGFGFGIVGKNLIKNSYQTEVIEGVKGVYELSPTYTISANYQNRFVIAAIDIALNESVGYKDLTGTINAYDTDNTNRQIAGVGVELFPESWFRFRAGYQTDLSDNTDDSFTAGLGFSPFDVFHFDLSGRYADDRNMGVSLQTRFTF
ncbi:conjugal transfer protein TraF [Shewanella maritima]|uniref:conjugal transfer protein TraF n=1 Tax=Shewanella maritima TaxID=2520507 RepID=UPI0037352CFC